MPSLLDPAVYHGNAHALPWAVVGLPLIALTVIIYRRQRASRVAVLFCAMIFCVAIWFAGFTAMLLATPANVALAWARVALAGIALLPAAVYDFTATALRLHDRKALTRTGWTISALFALVAFLSPAIVASVAPHPWGWYPWRGPLMTLFVVWFVAAIVLQLVEALAELRRTKDPRRRRRIARLLISFVIVYFAMIDFAPMFGVDMQPVGYIPVIAFIVVAAASIRRHRLPRVTAARAAREILDTMADALFVIDADARIRVVNGAVKKLLGFEESDLLGKSIDTLEEAESDATISRTLHELARRGPIRDQERLFRSKHHAPINVSVSISPVSEHDVQEGAVVIARDIRERKRVEHDLHAAMRRLEQSNRELEDFAYVASHDLQEPLRKIQAFGDLLKSKHSEALPAQAQDYIDRMQSAARRMQVLINDLLTFSRVTTKAQPFVAVDLHHVAQEVAHDLEIRAHDAGGRIDIGSLPTVDADPLQMRQLLQNLVSNGLKFHRDGVPPAVSVEGTTNGRSARIVVRDNGIGFEEKYAEKIFTMFERLHGRGKYEGTGIGLAICRKIVERHGGEIVARSTPGEGSSFTVTLPLSHHEDDGMEGTTA